MPFFADFTAFCGSLALVRLVVRIATDFPQVRFHGLFATGSVLLSSEVDLVLRDVVQIALTSLHSSRYSGEACASIQLFGSQRSATLYFVAQVEAVALVGGSCRYASSIFEHECWPLLLGLLSAPETLSIPAEYVTFAIVYLRFYLFIKNICCIFAVDLTSGCGVRPICH